MNDKNCNLLIRNVRVKGSDDLVDISIKDEIILKIGSDLDMHSENEFDGTGYFAEPPFVDPHTHIDKAFLKPSPNVTGTLEEAIAIMQENKNVVFELDFDKRVEKALLLALLNGTLYLRTHVDVDKNNGSKSVEVLLKIKEQWKDYIDIQLVAFPQDGLAGNSEVKKYFRNALEIGADVIGGIPAIEGSNEASREHIDFLFQLADEFDKDIDMHIDESDDPDSRTLEMLAEATLRSGWQGRVAAAHCCALSAYPDVYAKKVIEKVAEAKMSIITNPLTNLVLQGRNDKHPVRRGITRVKELITGGINVSCGSDNLQDVFFPFGQCDMLEVAFVTCLAAHMTGVEEIDYVLNMTRENAASILGIKDYSLRENNAANLVLIPAKSNIDMISYKPTGRVVIRKGKIICGSVESQKPKWPIGKTLLK